jgi:signal transduction histidine kinase
MTRPFARLARLHPSPMKRRNVVAAMVAASLFLLAVLAVFAVELSNNQAKSKNDIEARVHERSVLASALLDSLFQTSAQVTPQDARNYGTATVRNAVLNRVRAGNTYLVLLSADGRVLAYSRGFTQQARSDLLSSAALRLLKAGEPWAVGNVLPYGQTGVINFGRSVPTAFGKRYLLSGFAPADLKAFLQGELRQVPGVKGAHDYLLDGNRRVLASTNPARPAGYIFRTPTQLAALRKQSGDAGGHYFDQVPLTGTTWRILLTAPDGALFASVSGWRRWVPWLILAAFALVGIAALALARRGLRSSEEVRDANARLADANEQLAQANLRLEELNGELAATNAALADSNDALERRATELMRSNSELDQFASIASHDLQEPLRKVRTFTQRVWETESASLSERARDDLQRANASAERMQRLIEDLLRFSRVSTQGRPFAPVDLGRVTGEVLEDLDESVRSSGATVHVGALPTISADEPQMRQLMQNLLSNAMKFRRQGVAPEVEVSGNLDGHRLTLVVRDNGIGFDPQYSRRIFRVFERLNGRSEYPGTGIGLALCRKIAERHGGGVLADSVPGEGSTFTVTLLSGGAEPLSEGQISTDKSDLPGTTQKEPYVAA